MFRLPRKGGFQRWHFSGIVPAADDCEPDRDRRRDVRQKSEIQCDILIGEIDRAGGRGGTGAALQCGAAELEDAVIEITGYVE